MILFSAKSFVKKNNRKLHIGWCFGTGNIFKRTLWRSRTQNPVFNWVYASVFIGLQTYRQDTRLLSQLLGEKACWLTLSHLTDQKERHCLMRENCYAFFKQIIYFFSNYLNKHLLILVRLLIKIIFHFKYRIYAHF